MASTLVALQTATVGAGGVSSVTFSSIPQTYNDLVIKGSARSTFAGNWDNLAVTFNGNSGAIYFNRSLVGTGSAAASANDGPVTSMYLQYVGAANNTANTFGNLEIYIPNYASSNNKSISTDSVSENNATAALTGLFAGLSQKTDPVTSITLATTSFIQYSTFTLYGVYNSALETTPEAPTIGTATAASTGANVVFTPSGTGAPATSYVATSSPGGITATGASSPILVTGLTSGTAYTFTVKGQNPGGTGAASAASNSVTPYDGYESIATVYGTGSSGTISFTSIPSTYTHLQVRILARGTFANTLDNTLMTLNSDTASNYSQHQLAGSGSAASAEGFASQSSMYTGLYPAASATANIFGTAIIDILDYANTNKYKTVRTLSGSDLNGSGYVVLRSGLWRSTSAVTSIQLPIGAGNYAVGSVFELYGIR